MGAIPLYVPSAFRHRCTARKQRQPQTVPRRFPSASPRAARRRARQQRKESSLPDPDSAITEADMVHVTWRFQKNGQNSEKLPFSRNDSTPARCFVRRALSARALAQRLGTSADTPMAVYKDDKGKVRFISNKHVEHLLPIAAKTVHNITDKHVLQRWTCLYLQHLHAYM